MEHKPHLHHALFGYREGHRLLSSSRTLSPSSERALLVLSDMSGPRMLDGFEEYISGYPVPGEDSYAFAKTWYAPEMERPGCVWTHVVIIDASSLDAVKNANTFRHLFKHPASVEPEFYKSPLPLDEAYINRVPLIPLDTIAEIISVLYGKPLANILIAADSSSQFEQVVLSIWSQQWPALRSTFKFCTGSLSSRSLAGQPFDLQVIPRRLSRELQRQGNNFVLYEPALSQAQANLEGWERYAALDVVHQDNLFEFLRKYADPSLNGRTLYRPLSEFWITWLERPYKEDTTLLPASVSTLYPSSQTGKALKTAIFGDISYPGPHIDIFNETQKLSELSRTTYFDSFTATDLHLRERAEYFWRTNRSDAEDLILKILASAPQPLSDEIMAGFLKAMTPQEAISFAGGKGGALIGIVSRYPDFILSDEFWDCNIPIHLLLDIIDLLKVRFDDTLPIQRWLPPLISSGRDDVAEAVVFRFKDAAITAFLDAYNDSQLTLPWPPSKKWKDALSSYADFVFKWINHTPYQNPKAKALLTMIVDPHDARISNLGVQFWSQLVESLTLLMGVPNAESAAFLLSIGFQHNNWESLDLIRPTFGTVHSAAYRENLSYRAWQFLTSDVPSLNWMSNWDKCERLRRALFIRFTNNGWPIEDFLKTVRDEEIFKEMIITASHFEEGEEYILRVAKAIFRDEVKQSNEEEHLLRKYTRKDRHGNLKLNV